MDKMRYYEQARKKVKQKQGFYAHLFSYVIVIGFLLVINLATGGFPWFLFPAAGWGMGLAFHALATFNVPGFSKDWEQRMIREEMLRMEEEEETLRWEIRQKLENKPGRALPPGELDQMDLERLKEVRKRYSDDDLV